MPRVLLCTLAYKNPRQHRYCHASDNIQSPQKLQYSETPCCCSLQNTHWYFSGDILKQFKSLVRCDWLVSLSVIWKLLFLLKSCYCQFRFSIFEIAACQHLTLYFHWGGLIESFLWPPNMMTIPKLFNTKTVLWFLKENDLIYPSHSNFLNFFSCILSASNTSGQILSGLKVDKQPFYNRELHVTKFPSTHHLRKTCIVTRPCLAWVATTC